MDSPTVWMYKKLKELDILKPGLTEKEGAAYLTYELFILK